MALNSLIVLYVSLRNYTLTHSPYVIPSPHPQRRRPSFIYEEINHIDDDDDDHRLITGFREMDERDLSNVSSNSKLQRTLSGIS